MRPITCCRYFVAFSFDTTIGLLLTIGLHRAALRGAYWFGARCGPRYGEASAVAVPPGSSGGDAGAGGRWFEVLQACGNYGG